MSETKPEWWTKQGNLGMVAHYLAHVRGFDGREVAGVIDQPWKWPELWIEVQTALEVEVDQVHVRLKDGRCAISLNGQGHLPCPVTLEQVKAALDADSLASGYALTGQMTLALERADRVAHRGEVTA